MKEVSGKELARILEKNGWKLARIRHKKRLALRR
jgi:predicted RNA binding protein YcfA (HicA-like mRNA interferase family)